MKRNLLRAENGTPIAKDITMKLSWRILYAAGQATMPHMNNEIVGTLGLVRMLVGRMVAPFRKSEKSFGNRPILFSLSLKNLLTERPL